MAEGARLESVFRGNSNAGSNPALSARFLYKILYISSTWLAPPIPEPQTAMTAGDGRLLGISQRFPNLWRSPLTSL